MNVLSLFDGMSCGQQALERVNIKVDKYFASEIDKYAIAATMHNYPNTIQLGSVTEVDGYSLPKIDLLIGGSPCQSFSFAGKRKGMSTKDEQEILTLEHYLQLKQEGFEFEGQSYLFWEYMRLLNELRTKNPNVYFLLENVEMGEKWERVLSKAIGVNGVHINSSLVSAQNRKRIYWTNIGMIPSGLFGDMTSIIKQPKDKNIFLKDILEKEVDEKYFLSERQKDKVLANEKSNNDDDTIFCRGGLQENATTYSNKSTPMTAAMGMGGGHTPIVYQQSGQAGYHNGFKENNKASALLQRDYKGMDNYGINVVKERRIITHIVPEIVSVRKYEVDIVGLQECLKKHKNNTNKQIAEKLQVPITNVEHWFRTDNYFSIPDANIWLPLKELLNIETDEFDKQIMEFEERESSFEKTNRVYDEDGIAPTLTSTSADERILVREVQSEELEIVLTSRDKRLQKIVDDNVFQQTEIAHLDTYNQKINKDKSPALTLPHHNDKFILAPTSVKEVIQLNNTNLKSNSGTQPYQQDRIYDTEGISPALSANKSDLLILEKYPQLQKSEGNNNLLFHRKGFKTNTQTYGIDGKSGTLDTAQGGGRNIHTLVEAEKSLNKNQLKKFNPNINSDKANTLTLAQGRAGSSEEYMDAVSKIANITSRIRKLTPVECCRLQTVKDNYFKDADGKNIISDSQQYKCLGNGWTIDVIAHILSYMNGNQ